MYTIIGSSGRDCVLFMFQLHGSKAGFLKKKMTRIVKIKEIKIHIF